MLSALSGETPAWLERSRVSFVAKALLGASLCAARLVVKLVPGILFFFGALELSLGVCVGARWVARVGGGSRGLRAGGAPEGTAWRVCSNLRGMQVLMSYCSPL